jgi:hypothetical protein
MIYLVLMYIILFFCLFSGSCCNFLKTLFTFQATFFTTYVLTSGLFLTSQVDDPSILALRNFFKFINFTYIVLADDK